MGFAGGSGVSLRIIFVRLCPGGVHVLMEMKWADAYGWIKVKQVKSSIHGSDREGGGVAELPWRDFVVLHQPAAGVGQSGARNRREPQRQEASRFFSLYGCYWSHRHIIVFLVLCCCRLVILGYDRNTNVTVNMNLG